MEISTPASLIIPVLKEAENIPTLIKRISQLHFNEHQFEVLLMDDNSQDGSVEIVNELRTSFPWVKLVVRQGPRGLSRAVLDGFKLARFPFLIVMDADLSHHPEKIPELLSTLTQPNIDLVIGSRYIPGGSIDADWPRRRKIISLTSAWLARTFLRLPLKDPLSGFIGIKKETLHRANNLNPIGWKIGLEMMVRCQCNKMIEIPISFSDRHAGKSKLTARVGFNYLKQLGGLLLFKLVNFNYGK